MKSCEMKSKNLFLENNNSDKETSATGRTTPRLQPAKRDQAAASARGNRFGFRQNVVRPASGIQPKFNEFDNVNNNGTAAMLDNDKRRSKSATAPTQRSSVVFAEPISMTVNEEQSAYTNAR